MRNRTRPDMPRSLREHGREWTDELMAAVREFRENGTPVPQALKQRYGAKDIRDALKVMYRDDMERYYCCYCEGEIVIVRAREIEHRKPKSVCNGFPEYTYEWDNLHLACKDCNGIKGDKWDPDPEKEILDAGAQTSISNDLTYLEDNLSDGIERKALSDRGETTISHAQLNRRDLRQGRLTVYAETMKLLMSIMRQKQLGQNVSTEIGMLRRKRFGKYGSMIEYLMDKYLDRCMRKG